MNVVTVKINGIEYNLKGEENEAYLHSVASHIDKKFKNILQYNSKLSTSDVAILTACNIADECFKLEDNNEIMLKDINEAKKQYQELQKQFEDMKKYIQSLENYNAELQIKLDSTEASRLIKKNEEENKELNVQVENMHEELKSYMGDKKNLLKQNKELRFELQSSKYKIMDLQNKLIENQIELAKLRRKDNSLLTLDEIK
ncbi:cell division protein ZapA [Clostridium sp. DL1XJH146]